MRGGPSDAEVVARVLGGDREAFGLVIRRYETGLLRFATRMLGSRDVAADAVAERLVRAYRHLAGCRDPSRRTGARAISRDGPWPTFPWRRHRRWPM